MVRGFSVSVWLLALTVTVWARLLRPDQGCGSATHRTGDHHMVKTTPHRPVLSCAKPAERTADAGA